MFVAVVVPQFMNSLSCLEQKRWDHFHTAKKNPFYINYVTNHFLGVNPQTPLNNSWDLNRLTIYVYYFYVNVMVLLKFSEIVQ